LGQFAAAFNGKPVAEITATEIDEWLRGLPVAATTLAKPLARVKRRQGGANPGVCWAGSKPNEDNVSRSKRPSGSAPTSDRYARTANRVPGA